MIEAKSSYLQASGASDCEICNTGFYCADEATSRQTMLKKMICPAGMHCEAGSIRAPDLVKNACSTGHYCLRGDEVGCLPTFLSHIRWRQRLGHRLKG